MAVNLVNQDVQNALQTMPQQGTNSIVQITPSNSSNSNSSRIARKVAGYLGGSALLAGGGAVCAIPVPGIQVLGGLMIASGLGTISGTACCDEVQERRYEEANTQHEILNKQQGAQIGSLQAENAEYKAENAEHKKLNDTNQKQISELQKEVAKLSKERENNRKIAIQMKNTSDDLKSGMDSYLASLQTGTRETNLNIEQFTVQLNGFQDLISRLEGDTVLPLTTLAQSYQETASKVLELVSVEERLRNSSQEFHRLEGRFEALLQSQEEKEEFFRIQIETLKRELDLLERQRMKLHELIGQEHLNIEAFNDGLKAFKEIVSRLDEALSLD